MEFPSFKYSSLVGKPDAYTSPFIFKPSFEEGKNTISSSQSKGDLTSALEMLAQIRREERDPEFMRQQLQMASEFDKERMKEAGKYKLLFDLPKTIMEGITGPSQIAAEGSRGIASSMMQAGSQIPQLVNYTPRTGYSYTPSRYYS
jgi:hypothetical protein